VVAIHWWMFWCIFFVFLGLLEFALAISWSHNTNDSKAFKAAANGNRMATDLNNNNNETSIIRPITFHRNSDLYRRAGRIIGRILVKCFGNIDYTKEPLSRNKVDYASRIIFPVLYILFVLIYIFASICPWASDFNGEYTLINNWK